MIRADVETTGPGAVIVSLQKGNEHEVLSISKLYRTDDNVNHREGEEKKQEQHAWL